ncbi:MAG: hypothetical protein ACYCYO_17735, partial [Bacilli bacterium]
MDVEEALKDVRLIKGLVAQARGEMFRGGAPFFLIWGVVWMIGYLLPIVGAPDGWSGPLWLSLDFLGFAASVIVGARIGRKIGPMPYLVRKWMWSGLVVLGLATSAMFITGHGQIEGGGSGFFVWPLVIGAWYTLAGLFFDSPGFLLLGLWLAVVSIVAPFLPVAYPVQVAAVAVFGAT